MPRKSQKQRREYLRRKTSSECVKNTTTLIICLQKLLAATQGQWFCHRLQVCHSSCTCIDKLQHVTWGQHSLVFDKSWLNAPPCALLVSCMCVFPEKISGFHTKCLSCSRPHPHLAVDFKCIWCHSVIDFRLMWSTLAWRGQLLVTFVYIVSSLVPRLTSTHVLRVAERESAHAPNCLGKVVRLDAFISRLWYNDVTYVEFVG